MIGLVWNLTRRDLRRSALSAEIGGVLRSLKPDLGPPATLRRKAIGIPKRPGGSWKRIGGMPRPKGWVTIQGQGRFGLDCATSAFSPFRLRQAIKQTSQSTWSRRRGRGVRMRARQPDEPTVSKHASRNYWSRNLRPPTNIPKPNPKHRPEAMSCMKSGPWSPASRGFPTAFSSGNTPKIETNTKRNNLRLPMNPPSPASSTSKPYQSLC